MDQRIERNAPQARLLGALRGIQAGVLGAFAMLVFMGIVSVAERYPWWFYPNLLSTIFYGSRALRSGLGWSTLAGAAFQVLLNGVAGAIFGAIFGLLQNGSRLILLGVIWGVAWFYGTQLFFDVVGRLIPLYVPELALLGAHTVFGLILGRMTAREDNQKPPEAPDVLDSESAGSIG